MKILGIDFGTKTIGLALSDPSHKIAFPFDNVAIAQSLPRIQALLHEQPIEKIILGKPLNMKGQPTAMTDTVEKFKQELSQLTDIPIEYVDERLSSKLADRSFTMMGVNTRNRRSKKDASEAALILQGYLDRSSSSSPRSPTW